MTSPIMSTPTMTSPIMSSPIDIPKVDSSELSGVETAEELNVVVPVVITSAINQLGSGQDFVTYGQIENKFDYLVVADGHGRGKITELLSSPSFDWEDIVMNDSGETILSAINKEIELKVNDTYRDGSTITIAKIYPTQIKVYSMGDSQAQIKINEVYYKTNNDNIASVANEIKEGTIEVANPHWSQHILNDTDITVTEGRYFILTNGEKLAMIRALGHELSTLQKMNELTLPIELDDEVSILVATDGLWDVVYEPELLSKFPEYDAADFTKLASDRWDQEWNYIVPSIFTDASGNAFPIEKMKVDSADDVGVVVYKRVSHSS